MYLKNPTHEDEGYWWVKVPSLRDPFIIEVYYRTWDHTRDGDMYQIIDGDQIVDHDQKEWFEYDFIEKVKPISEGGLLDEDIVSRCRWCSQLL